MLMGAVVTTKYAHTFFYITKKNDRITYIIADGYKKIIDNADYNLLK